MKSEILKNKKVIKVFCIFVFLFFISFLIRLGVKKIKKKKKKQEEFTLDDLIPPPNQIILPPSPAAITNLNYCIYYTPQDKEFSEMPVKYKHGISIIITAYKAVKYIKETLDSILNQIWFNINDNWEILLGVDGCDETLNYLHSIRKNYKNLRIFMMKKNKGTYITSNTMMSIAKYDYLLRFDSDDIMNPNLIEI
jgi:cellulose synthase/poly-beta-1,6-N-acetylglucosamine synthase-like glycosyltransferase